MSTPAQTLSRAREQLSDAKAQDERSAEVLRSSQATLATLRSSIRDMNARTAEREETLSASAQLEARWKDFQDRFDQVLTKLADNVGKAMEKEGSAAAFANALEGSKDEKWDTKDVVERKTRELAELCRRASGSIVVFTGAGISTACGIPDYRSPMNTKLASGPGVWTLKDDETKKLERITEDEDDDETRASPDHDLAAALPARTHAAIAALHDAGIVKHVISQNIDGLHHRGGLPREALSELHGNVWVDRCDRCGAETVRDALVQHTRLADVPTLKKGAAKDCPHCSTPSFCHCTRRSCECCDDAPLKDTIVNFGESLHAPTLERAQAEAEAAELCLVLGSSCRVAPAADLPRTSKAHVVVNLQPTPLDASAGLRIGARCDDVLGRLLELLNVRP